MEYKQLIEMPRFHIDYSITFLNKMYKEQISSMIEKAYTNDDCILFIQCDEYESFVLNLQFSRFLFCGFSCSDAIEYLFNTGPHYYNVASTLSLILMVLILICTLIMNRFSDDEEAVVI